MLKSRRDIELTAPAGSWEAIRAAIQAGADSIYFGISKLNMRARSAANFTKNDIKNITSLCGDHGIKAYLTLNTVIFNNELGLIRDIIHLAKDNGVSAIIASDLAVIDYSVKNSMPVHISTQLNVSNIESLKFFSRFADAIVLARELSLDQIKNISDIVELEDICGPSGKRIKLEIFVHGALCMATSGKCYLSLHEHNHSANRGDCFQVCRRSYMVKDKESGRELEIDNEYIMSPKDLSTIHFLDKIIASGVRILKIEGRARSAEYVKTVVSCYNEAINSIIDKSYTREKIDDWKNRLSGVFNRGFWDGYYLGQKLGEWSDQYGSKATKVKSYIGKASNFYNKLGVAEFIIESGTLKPGDEVIITGPTTGVVEMIIKELHTDKGPSDIAVKGEKCSFPVDTVIRRSDKLYILKSRFN